VENRTLPICAFVAFSSGHAIAQIGISALMIAGRRGILDWADSDNPVRTGNIEPISPARSIRRGRFRRLAVDS
jgi:hypothetical protein